MHGVQSCISGQSLRKVFNMTSHPYLRENLPPINSGQTFVAGNREYVIGGSLGDGAIGVVRRALEKESGMPRVIKLLAPESKYIESSSIDDISARFRREGMRGQELDHENLIEVLAYEENEGGSKFLSENDEGRKPEVPFIVMEHGGNRTLEGYIKRTMRKIPKKSLNFSDESLFIAREISKAIVYLHRRRLIHRDIKPANIFLTKTSPPRVRIGDFGIVKWSDFKATVATGTLTVSGQQGLGTLKYMPPEQSTNPKEVSVKSDMWSLGITLWELFTNQILADYHFVYQLRDIRMERSNLLGRMYKLGFGTTISRYTEIHPIMEALLDSFLGQSSRPSSAKLSGMLKTAHQDKNARTR